MRKAVMLGVGHSDPTGKELGKNTPDLFSSVLKALACVHTGGLQAMQQGEGWRWVRKGKDSRPRGYCLQEARTVPSPAQFGWTLHLAVVLFPHLKPHWPASLTVICQGTTGRDFCFWLCVPLLGVCPDHSPGWPPRADLGLGQKLDLDLALSAISCSQNAT